MLVNETRLQIGNSLEHMHNAFSEHMKDQSFGSLSVSKTCQISTSHITTLCHTSRNIVLNIDLDTILCWMEDLKGTKLAVPRDGHICGPHSLQRGELGQAFRGGAVDDPGVAGRPLGHAGLKT